MRNYIKKKKNKGIEMNNSLFWVRKEENTAGVNELRGITSSGTIRVGDTVMQVERGLRALMDRTMIAFKMLLCHVTLRIFMQYLCIILLRSTSLNKIVVTRQHCTVLPY